MPDSVRLALWFVVLGLPFALMLTATVVWFDRRPIKVRPRQIRVVTHAGWKLIASAVKVDADATIYWVRTQEEETERVRRARRKVTARPESRP